MSKRGSIRFCSSNDCMYQYFLSANAETIQELRHVSQFHRRDDLRIHAYSALDLAVGVLREFQLLEGKLNAPVRVGVIQSVIRAFLLWIRMCVGLFESRMSLLNCP